MAVAVGDVKPFTGNRPTPVGQWLERIVDITFDSSYPTGGEPLSAATLGFRKILFVNAPRSGANLFQYDYTNSKLLAYVATTGVEVADTTDLHTLVARIMVVGI